MEAFICLNRCLFFHLKVNARIGVCNHGSNEEGVEMEIPFASIRCLLQVSINYGNTALCITFAALIGNIWLG